VDPTQDDPATNTPHTPAQDAIASSIPESSVVALPGQVMPEIQKGRLLFRMPPPQASPVCYTNCQIVCFNCNIVCMNPSCVMSA